MKTEKPYSCKAYALRHKATGEWMPMRLHASGNGHTYWEPTSGERPHDPHPRLFFSRRSATNARSAWANGPYVRGTATDGDWETGYFTVDAGPEPVAPPVPRALEDLEIVEFSLKEEPRD